MTIIEPRGADNGCDDEGRTMCDGEGLGLIQMAMAPIGLAVTAGIAAALFIFARWVVTDGT